MKALCLLSGGMDSAVAAAIARARGGELHALSFDYGQRHRRELRSARAVARALGARSHGVLRVDLRQIGGSALTARLPLERRRSAREILRDPRIPSTYVPLRNTIFLVLAAARAEVAAADRLVLGANAVDYSHYPDCRPEYYRAMARAIALGSKRGAGGRPLGIWTPVIGMTKAQIVRRGLALGVPFHLTWSCYAGGARPCGRCDSCLLRAKGFEEAGVEDPLLASGRGR
ncbi:MAG: 7-cyano-7-deazaguanine synthase QueC [Halobacteria archaeon]